MCTQRIAQSLALVAPARERGLKFKEYPHMTEAHAVAPARERGLKYRRSASRCQIPRRSREGAWIEMLL